MEVFSISDGVRIVGISKAAIRKYCGLFQSHLSAGANPSFGTPRRFTADDLKLFHYVRGRTAGGLGLAGVAETLPEALDDYVWELPIAEQPKEEKVAISKAQIEKYEDRMNEAQQHIERQANEIEDLTGENKRLISENGELRGELKAYKRTWLDKLLGRKD